MRLLPVLAALVVLPFAGCIEAAQHVTLWIENNERHDQAYEVALNGAAPRTVDLSFDGSAPNIRVAFDGNVSGRVLNLWLRETQSGSETERSFLIEEGAYFVASYWSQRNEWTVLQRAEPPVFD